MNLGCFPSMDDAYRELVDKVCLYGERHSPRGQSCLELRPAQFSIWSPAEGLYTGRSRKLNYRFLAIETLSYIAGWGDRRHAELMVAANKNVARFVNPVTGAFDGAYGPRLSMGLPDVVAVLAKDRHSRQAVASIWSPGIPNESLDVPCTISLQFYRSGVKRLGMVVTMRSNDLNWGTPYDVAAFCAIQLAVASALGLEAGDYHHHAGSLHVYEATAPEVSRTILEDFVPVAGWPPYQSKWLSSPPSFAWDAIRYGAEQVLEAAYQIRVVEKRPWSEVVVGGSSNEKGWALMIRNGGTAETRTGPLE